MAVLLAGPTRAPRLLDGRRVELSDPAVPASRQPYHAGFGTAQTDAAVVSRLVRVVRGCARRAVTELLRVYRARGVRVRRVALVVGSDIDPASIANPHIRAHASEGRLFRTALEEALDRRGLGCVVIRERDVYATAARALRRVEPRFRREVAALGDGSGGPWRAEHKSAAAGAWLALASSARRR